MNRSKLGTLAAVATLALTTVGSPPAQAGPPEPTQPEQAAPALPSVAPVDWGRCRQRELRKAGVRCGFVTVPLDYDNPTGRKIKIAVSRVRHTTRAYRGVMLINPGGPGGSGLAMSTYGSLMPRRSGAAYDWIGFDPRGVGASRPALSCKPHYFHADRPPYVPRNGADIAAWTRRARSYADACGAKYGSLLEHMKSVDTVLDMEMIRRALRARRISYYGYSHGTYLGQVYATLFPDRVRRMVLDSNIDPTKTWAESTSAQTLAFQRVYDEFFRWVARHRATYHLGRTAEAVQRHYLRQRRLLRDRPAAGVLGASEFDDALVVAGYTEPTWPDLAAALSALVNRDNARPLIRWWRLVDTPGDDNQYAAFLATLCTDEEVGSIEDELARTRRLHRQAPIPAWGSMWFSASCFFWPAEPGEPVEVTGNAVPALLFGGTLDGATPFADSLAVRGLFPGSRLVAIRGGTTHGSTPDLSGPCARRHLAAYLTSGTLPMRKPGRRADVVCPAPPKPKIS